ncbi:pyruvate, phosphate dikinase [Candidatus Poribacteria bacterium]|nr:pyruvate, phosphate dikinase [Candidatus Poribacteria bacterium]
MSQDKHVYFFGDGKADGKAEMKKLLGGKGANLAEMTNLGIPVPPGFTITTKVCRYYYDHDKTYPEDLDEQIKENIAKVEEVMGMKFGDPEDPLLFSVRSGAAMSMPGMMETILNVGLNDVTVEGLAKKTGNPRFAYDSYRRLIQMFSDVAMGVDIEFFEDALAEMKKDKGVELDTDLDADDLKKLIEKYKEIYKREMGEEFPQDPMDQLLMARDAVFGSRDSERAIIYRRINGISDDEGSTAVNVQTMVFGNMGDDSGTGVAFTRNPATGENKFFADYLFNAQGEDVVAGIRTPIHVDELQKAMPEVYNQLREIEQKLEKHYKDMQDLEFTVQQGKLWLLQTRRGKRTAMADVRIAVEMVKEGMIDKETAVSRVPAEKIEQLLHPMVNTKSKAEVIGEGLPAGPGAAVGKAVFTAETAMEMAKLGEKVILVRNFTSPEDVGGMHASQGILTATGGMTSHAAIVGRDMGKCCVVGCSDITVDESGKKFTAGDIVVKEGDVLSLDGHVGKVMLGEVELIEPTMSGDFGELMEWVDEIRTLGVRTNTDTPAGAKRARSFGAEGIGLCRTEHMFFEEDRITTMREMIVANNEEDRRKALEKLLPMQRQDFIEIFEAMEGLPVIIRTLDPPLHEFLPHSEEEVKELAEEVGIDLAKLKDKIESLHEANPMLGHRGCRLGIAYPEITEMQARAIIEAAVEVAKKGKEVIPEIMIPLVGQARELELQKEICDRVAKEVLEEAGVELEYMVGTMIELPRAALTADEIAEFAEFFSFGTNDLTQTTFGMSRDDAEGKFLQDYIEGGILEVNPFMTVDEKGVGELIRIAVEKGRSTTNDLEVGICGEHGGDPKTVDFCHRVGLNYVSCSPFRVPVARLAAAHAKLREEGKMDE